MKVKCSPDGEGRRERSLGQRFSTDHLGELVEMQILIQKVRARVWDSAFPTSFLVTSVLLALSPHTDLQDLMSSPEEKDWKLI